MKLLNFGSLNIDHVYTMDHFVEGKETQAAETYERYVGGKALTSLSRWLPLVRRSIMPEDR
ncbi:MAG: hypothetical protein ACLVJ6_08750 [Merdibacter sp.]